MLYLHFALAHAEARFGEWQNVLFARGISSFKNPVVLRCYSCVVLNSQSRVLLHNAAEALTCALGIELVSSAIKFTSIIKSADSIRNSHLILTA
jgi:hypothetical protein